MTADKIEAKYGLPAPFFMAMGQAVMDAVKTIYLHPKGNSMSKKPAKPSKPKPCKGEKC